MKLYTKKGDQGQTSLLGGARVPKYADRIEAYGTLDELNTVVGALRDHHELNKFAPLIKVIQSRLFTIGSHLAMEPGKHSFKLPELSPDDIELLEKSMDQMDEVLPELKNFVLPGGHPANSAAHLARVVCRRAERLVVALDEKEPVHELILPYLNRLSDWLFQLARMASHTAGAEELPWMP